MAKRHGVTAVAIHQDHMQEKHLVCLHKQRVPFIEHRKVDPDWVVDRAHAVAARLKSRVAEPVFVEYFGVGHEYVAHRLARPNGDLASLQCLGAGRVHAFVAVGRLPNDDRAHHGGVIARVCAGPFKRELVGWIKVPAAREVSAQ